MRDFYATRPQPLDQADGLRRMFTAPRRRCLAVVGNPHVAFGGVLIERLTTALAAWRRHTLVVDAADRSPAAPELSWLDLAACVEPLSPDVCYLPARGLPSRHIDTRGSAARVLEVLGDAAPQADTLVLHANALDLSRIFARRHVRPVVMMADMANSVTDAYASLKLLATRNGVLGFDVMIAADPYGDRASRIVRQLADCAEKFLGVTMHAWARVDPACDSREAPDDDLLRLVGDLLAADDEIPADALRGPVANPFLPEQPTGLAVQPVRN